MACKIDSPYAKKCKDEGGSVYTKKDGSCGCKHETIAGQDIERSSKGTRAAFNVGDDIKKGDIIHGVTKYIGKSGEIPGDLDFTYRPSTRKSSQGADVRHWTITGHKK